jgi:hypothetical protein
MKLFRMALTCSILLGPATAFAAEEAAAVSGSKRRVEVARNDKTMFLHVNQAAEAFGWQAKIVIPGKLLTLCREGKGGLCIPLRLEKVKTLRIKKTLFVEANALARALRFSIDDRKNRVTLSRATSKDAKEDSDVPAYNSVWEKGRGFRVGQTLPDIPLYDMQGQEVRFSKFLGKQYVVYCWASW